MATLTPGQRAALMRAINRFEKAARMHEMMGCQHPDTWPDIEHAYHAARDALVRVFERAAARLTP